VFAASMTHDLNKAQKEPEKQGDQIGRIFAAWATHYFGTIIKCLNSPNFISRKMQSIIFEIWLHTFWHLI
jgi:hypothetical protein